MSNEVVCIAVPREEWEATKNAIMSLTETVSKFMNPPKELYTMEEARAFLNVSKSTMERYINAGKFPIERVQGSRIRYVRREWLLGLGEKKRE